MFPAERYRISGWVLRPPPLSLFEENDQAKVILGNNSGVAVPRQGREKHSQIFLSAFNPFNR